MTFEVFHRPRAPKTEPLVTVQENGALRLNSAAYRLIDQPTYVHLLHDLPAKKVAIRAVAGASDTTHRAGGSGLVAAAEFIRFAGLAPGRYRAALEGELLVVDCG